MKLEIQNKNGVVDEAWTYENDLSFSLYINTNKRWIRPDSEMSDGKSRSWIYHVEGDEGLGDMVTLIAENERDIEQLERVPFQLQCKEQLWIMLPHESVVA